MQYGIDISSNNGSIDFAKVKANGVEFVVIRSTTKNNNPDVRLAEYVKGCYECDIPFAFYKYMYALSTESAKLEATKVIEALNKIGVIPSKEVIIFADVEDKMQFALTTQTLTSVVKAFRKVIEDAGYTFGLYMSLSPYKTEIDASQFDVDIWIARYPETTIKKLKDIPDDKYKPTVKNGNLIGWQWSSKGQIAGISGNVDLDIYYDRMNKPEVSPKYYKTPEFTLVESLNKVGVYPSMENRKKIAKANDIPDYVGSYEQNVYMLMLLNEGRLKQI